MKDNEIRKYVRYQFGFVILFSFCIYLIILGFYYMKDYVDNYIGLLSQGLENILFLGFFVLVFGSYCLGSYCFVRFFKK